MTIKFPATIEFEVESEPKKFELDFNICKNPECDCNGINMVVYNHDKNINFFLDFNSRSFRKRDYCEEDERILKSFISFLGKSPTINFDFFNKNYKYVKEKVKTRKETIDSFELGNFLVYRDIIWGKEDIRINVEGRNHIIFDAYCVTPDCNCKEVALNFFEDMHKLGFREPDFSLVYNYANRNYRGSVGIKDIQVREIIQNISDIVNNKFKKRHIQLKKEVKKDIE